MEMTIPEQLPPAKRQKLFWECPCCITRKGASPQFFNPTDIMRHMLGPKHLKSVRSRIASLYGMSTSCIKFTLWQTQATRTCLSAYNQAVDLALLPVGISLDRLDLCQTVSIDGSGKHRIWCKHSFLAGRLSFHAEHFFTDCCN